MSELGGESSHQVESVAPQSGIIARVKTHRLVQGVQGDGLRAKAMRGSGWTVAGFGASQVIRLGSNLVLTRMLFPEAFGLMALALVFLQGLQMLSDIGVGPSVVQNKRGDEVDFLATAWTMQILRGLFLFAITCILAYPVSRIYEEPQLFPILLFIGFSAAIQGFQSIGFATAKRNMALGRLAIIELVGQCVGVAAMITWASVNPSVWALVVGGVAASSTRAAMGFWILRSDANFIRFDRVSAGEIFRFGRWIFLATTFTYFGGQGLRLVQGYVVTIDVLGLISIAVMLGMVVDQLIGRIGNLVLFPAFAKIHNDRPEELAGTLREVRTKLFLLSCPLFMILIVLGRDLIYYMYDDRYLEAGLFLVISATGSAIVSQRTPFGMVLIASGDVFGHAMVKGITAFARVSAVIIGFSINGVIGMLVGDIVAQGVIYPFEVWRLRRQGLWMPVFDIAVFAGYLAVGSFSYFVGPFLYTP